jgi:hypothetical protein
MDSLPLVLTGDSDPPASQLQIKATDYSASDWCQWKQQVKATHQLESTATEERPMIKAIEEVKSRQLLHPSHHKRL